MCLFWKSLIGKYAINYGFNFNLNAANRCQAAHIPFCDLLYTQKKTTCVFMVGAGVPVFFPPLLEVVKVKNNICTIRQYQ